MTKKSPARQQRDAMAKFAQVSPADRLKENRRIREHQKRVVNFWDEVEIVRVEARALIAQGQEMLTMSQDARLDAHMTPQKLEQKHRLADALAKDLVEMNTKLTDVGSQHAGKTGGSEDFSEQLTAISVSESYHAMMSHFQGTTAPIIFELSEIITAAGDAYNQARDAYLAAQAAQQNDKVDALAQS